MSWTPEYIKASESNCFSPLITDYLNRKEELKACIEDFHSTDAVKKRIENRPFSLASRQLLTEVLREQYNDLNLLPETEGALNQLLNENCFTVCTAHQPCVLTGPLYFIYKIVHAIRLCAHYRSFFPDHHFVPVFYVGSEDHDLEEIGHVSFGNKDYHWSTNQKGACGRMHPGELKFLLDELKPFIHWGKENEKQFFELLETAYTTQPTLARATRFIVHSLLGQYGLLVLDADDPRFKKQFASVMHDELLHSVSVEKVHLQAVRLSINYTLQATPRAINLFYLGDQFRERIERDGDQWRVHNSSICWNQEALEMELEQFPERFSPNVILRPLLQERILPNVTFIGGGGELAYWMELKAVFDHFQIPFPLLVLRQSVLWLNVKTSKNQLASGISNQGLFQTADQNMRVFFRQDLQYQELEKAMAPMHQSFDLLRQLADADVLLQRSVEAHLAGMKRLQERINKKFLNRFRRIHSERLQKLRGIYEYVFPGGILQERRSSLFDILKECQEDPIELLMKYTDPDGQRFLILRHE